MSIDNPEDPNIDQILDFVDAEMGTPKKPKVLLFDIGGVCVVSPMQAILDFELGAGIPPGWINYSISKTAPDGFWHKLERGDILMDKSFYDGFTKDLRDPSRWQAFYQREQQRNPDLPKDVPPVRSIDGERLFNDMMNSSNFPDPWMHPALLKLKQDGGFLLGALSNTVIFPPGHALYSNNFLDDPVRSIFDVFVSSAHVHLRKPDPRIYQHAVKRLNEYALQHASTARGKANGWEQGIKPNEILFLDDIGENLKAARKQGFETVKVPLGRAYEAVEELERITELTLAGDHPKIPIKPRPRKPEPKL